MDRHGDPARCHLDSVPRIERRVYLDRDPSSNRDFGAPGRVIHEDISPVRFTS